ncbi:hypothetical protein NPIL_672191 [Nephila pilipes]|uniref:Uncharacterized protein n=1 Tax=Nephila pilipes TaxID=299642 RepID=A0A8X6NU85_NEPPI|nr:hypothetical protein NPIL_672191 [Nephila pilipes]
MIKFPNYNPSENAIRPENSNFLFTTGNLCLNSNLTILVGAEPTVLRAESTAESMISIDPGRGEIVQQPSSGEDQPIITCRENAIKTLYQLFQ